MTAPEPTSIEADRHPFAPSIQNWARWSTGHGSAGHCASIEHRYRPERLTEAEGAERNNKGAKEPLKIAEAEMVENAVCALESAIDKSILIARYITRDADRVICRRFELRYRDLEMRVFSIISDVEVQFEHIADVMARNPGLKIVRHRVGKLLPYGRATR